MMMMIIIPILDKYSVKALVLFKRFSLGSKNWTCLKKLKHILVSEMQEIF